MANTPYTFVGPSLGQLVSAAHSKLLIAAQVYDQQKQLNEQFFAAQKRSSSPSAGDQSKQLNKQFSAVQKCPLPPSPDQESPKKKLNTSFQKVSNIRAPFNQLLPNLIVSLSTDTKMGRKTENSNPGAGKGAKDNKKPKDDPPSKAEDNKEKPANGEGSSSQVPTPGATSVNITSTAIPPGATPSIADEVITHFTAHWEIFKQGFSKDVTSLTTKVQTLETTTTSLQTRVTALEQNPVQSTAPDAALLS